MGRVLPIARIVSAILRPAALSSPSIPDYSIYAIRYADSHGDSVADLFLGTPKDEKNDTTFAIWLIRGDGRNILFDSGGTKSPRS